MPEMIRTKQSARLVGRASSKWLACGASAIAMALCSTAAQAQDADEQEDIITVTGSRIRTDGMQAPVPVTVVAAEEIEALSPGAV